MIRFIFKSLISNRIRILVIIVFLYFSCLSMDLEEGPGQLLSEILVVKQNQEIMKIDQIEEEGEYVIIRQIDQFFRIKKTDVKKIFVTIDQNQYDVNNLSNFINSINNNDREENLYQVNSDFINPVKKELIKSANDLLGKKPNEVVIVNGKKFILDCIGTISAIYYSVGIDLTENFYKYEGNGVARLYYSLKDNNAISIDKIPNIGDIIFWDHTWDRNNDGIKYNDPLTHAGMVVRVDDDGTIHYIHENYIFGIVIEKMNIFHPFEYKDEQGKIINSPLYIASSERNHPVRWLSGDLFKIFGYVLE